MPRRNDIQTTAERNLALIRELFETLNAGGSKAVVSRLEDFADPGIEWKGVAATSAAPGGDVVYRGYEGMERFWAENGEVFEGLHFDNVRCEAFGDRIVVAFTEAVAMGRGSGIPFSQEMASIYELDGGKIVAGENIASHTEARERAHALAEESRDA
jgi:ketosteroid isomerase-like protein